MPIQLFPEPTLSTLNADTFTVPETYTKYQIVKTINPGIYTMTTFPTTSVARISGFNEDNTVFSEQYTTSGTVSINFAKKVINPYISIDNGTNSLVTLTYVSALLSGTSITGTLDTITSTGTYNQTGKLYVLCIGGGGGGAGAGTNGEGRSGGGGGYQVSGFVYTNTPTSVTIGAGGNGSSVKNAAGSTGGDSLFGNFVGIGSGGAGGFYGTTGGAGRGTDAIGGTTGENGTAIEATTKSITNLTNGGGGGGNNNSNNTRTNGGGSGIGTGGQGGIPNAAGLSGTGYGAGGGGGCGSTGANTSRSGGAGTQGVIYVLRGF